MKTFIDPEDINILCGISKADEKRTDEKKSQNQSYDDAQENSREKQSFWSRCISKVKSLWGKAKPIIIGLTSFFTVATACVKCASDFYRQCQSMRRGFA